MGLSHRIADHVNFESGDPVLQSLLLAGFLSGFGFRNCQMFFSDCFRQVVYFDFAATGQYDCTFNFILEFADISRPMIAHECLDGILRECLNIASYFFRILPQKVRCQERNIRSNLAQGRHSEMDDVQPEEKILTETILFDFFLQVFIGRGN